MVCQPSNPQTYIRATLSPKKHWHSVWRCESAFRKERRPLKL